MEVELGTIGQANNTMKHHQGQRSTTALLVHTTMEQALLQMYVNPLETVSKQFFRQFFPQKINSPSRHTQTPKQGHPNEKVKASVYV